MSDLPFGIETKNTYAALTPADLQSMGKQAAVAYLCGGTSLNDAIIKLARNHPSISPHQVQRVVEYANQETFAKLFADNEKYASDKNIEFDVADPGEVLLELNNGAKPHIMTADSSDYASGPVKLGHSDVEADLELCRMFGVEPVSPGMEKSAGLETNILAAGAFTGLPEAAAYYATGPARGTKHPILGYKLSHEQNTLIHGMTGALTGMLAMSHFPPAVTRLAGPIAGGAVGGLTGLLDHITAAPKKPVQGGKSKEASAVVDRILASGEQAARPPNSLLPNNEGTQARGSLTHDEESRKVANMGMLPPGEGAHDPMAMPAGAGSGMDQGDHHDQMLEVQREIELAKKRQELQKIQQTTLDAMNPEGPPGGVPAPAPGMEGGPPADASPPGAPPAPPGGAPVEMAPMPPEQQMPPPAAGAITAPPGAAMPKMGAAREDLIEFTKEAKSFEAEFRSKSDMVHGGKLFGQFRKGYKESMARYVRAREGGASVSKAMEMSKSAAFTKEAMDYAKGGRLHSGLVLDDLAAATSLERIKEATAGRADYPMANPYGELIRTKQKLAKLLEDATYAKDKNADLHKEATVRFQKAVVQHMYDGGNLAEVAHLMSAVHGEPVSVKTAMTYAMEELVRHGIDPVKAQVDAIQYQMEKGASARVPNLDHPIAQAYADLHKLAEGSAVLGESWAQLKGQYDQVESVLQEAMAYASAS